MEDDKLKNNSAKKSKNGGARPGAGRPKGSMNESTKIRMAAKLEFQRRVAKHADELFHSQFDLAKGEKYLMVVRTIGEGSKTRRETEIVTDPELIKQFLDEQLENTDDEFYYMTTKPANNMALDSLLNRAFGKAEESLDITSGGEQINSVSDLSDEELHARIDEYLVRRKK